MWLVLALVLTAVFAPVQETVRMAQVHVFTGPERRRRFSVEQKRAIVGAASAPGAVVSEIARRADICTSLIYRWRRELGLARGGFAEVVVTPALWSRRRPARFSLPWPRRRSRSRFPAGRGRASRRRPRRRWRRRGGGDPCSGRGPGVAGGRPDGHAPGHERLGATLSIGTETGPPIGVQRGPP